MIHRIQDQPVWELLQLMGAAANAQGSGLYMVGGFVRDILLGRPNLDIDVVVEGDAIAFAQSLYGQHGGQIVKHPHFGTATWQLTPQLLEKWGVEEIDFAGARTEIYETSAALPKVRRGSIEEDLHRRDFTINALAIRLAPEPAGQLLDFYQGERDLQDGVIRVLHDLSFIDDPTRMPRAVRFEQRFGFQIEPHTLELLGAALPMLEKVSGDRLRNELNLILAEETALSALERMGELGILSAIHPTLKLDETTRQHYRILQEVRAQAPWQLAEDFDHWHVLAFSLLTYGLSEAEIERISQRLTLSRDATKQLLAIRQGCHYLAKLPEMSPSQVLEHYEKLGETAWIAGWIMSNPAARAMLEQLAMQWRYVKPNLKGDELIKMGLPRGRAVGKLLHEIRDAWLDGHLESVEDEYDFARNRIKAYTADR